MARSATAGVRDTPDQASEEPWRAILRRLLAESGAQMTFGGNVRGQELRLEHFESPRTAALVGVRVTRGTGLGGRVWREASVLGVHDYEVASEITHHYDDAVLAEGLRGVVAAPVMLDGTVRGVVYAGVRESPGIGDRLRDATTTAATRMSRWLSADHEVERRVAARLAHRVERESAATERLRSLHAELLVMRRDTADGTTQAHLDVLLGSFAQPLPAREPGLSEQQRTVLVLVATGAGYTEVADRLRLRPATVKTYMRDIIAGLGVHSRHEAVVEGRRRGLID